MILFFCFVRKISTSREVFRASKEIDTIELTRGMLRKDLKKGLEEEGETG